MELHESFASLSLETRNLRCRICTEAAIAQHMDVPLLEVPKLLGLSRCVQLARTSRDWWLACATRVSGIPASLRQAFGEDYCEEADSVWARRVACMSLFSILGAPGFNPNQSTEVSEDEVFWCLSDRRFRKWDCNMLRSPFQTNREMVTAFGPRCKIAGPVMDVLFAAPLHLRPIHYAVLHSSPRLVNMMLAAASRAGVFSEAVQDFVGVKDDKSISALFLAVLFAEQDVVATLKRHGATTNSTDVQASLKLYRAHIWDDLHARLNEVQLNSEADDLLKSVRELHQREAPPEP
eukprot:TRINITY_DN22407_c0_g1_i1.p1 TRINITY_DN22407_c0_g1~~TRINITY_DN22407_c0_g1_i1.p1  ORF type:complete len:293 (+),score=34.03 TRINITY_DN22407_c0_g1_i1:98-976(+)